MAGERSEDAGGPYRDTFAAYASELMSTRLPLFIRCANAVGGVGGGRDLCALRLRARACARDFCCAQHR
jgi:hypothetical protein